MIYKLQADDIDWRDIQAAKSLIRGVVQSGEQCAFELSEIKQRGLLDIAIAQAVDTANFAIVCAYLDSRSF